jgi:hypothetical protein
VSLYNVVFSHTSERIIKEPFQQTKKMRRRGEERKEGGREGGREKTTGKDMDENKCLIHTNEQ